MGCRQEDYLAVAALLKRARRVLFITGAGVSAESGIPTFRGRTAAFASGETQEGVPFEEALSRSAFERDPQLSWQYFFWIEQAVRGRKPNPAHRAIAALEQTGKQVCVVTQNIDSLHQQAGSRRVIELHGALRRIICTGCEYFALRDTYEGLPALPRCPQCHALLRPDIVLYEEQLPLDALEEFEAEQAEGIDLLFSVGTTSIFSYVTRPVFLAGQRGIPTVEINPEETPLSGCVNYRFATPAGTVLERLSADSGAGSQPG